MDTHISRITEFDNNFIRSLLEKAGVSQPEPNPEFFKDEKNIMLVAHTGSAVSGFLWAYVLLSPDKSRHRMYLYSIDVFEPFRRQGIATLMIRHLKKIAWSYNCYKMFLQTGKNNPAAVALYRGTGGIALNYGEDVTFTYDQE